LNGGVDGGETETVSSILSGVNEVYDKNIKFSDLKLSKDMINNLTSLGHIHPSIIQRDTVPHALLGRDVLGVAETGSGKTYAFLLPIIERLSRVTAIMERRRHNRKGRVDVSIGTKALILEPTRELVDQCGRVLRTLLTDNLSHLTFQEITGGSVDTYESRLLAQPDIIVATPGRLLGILQACPSAHIEMLEIIVLDEADRLLELGFRADIVHILSHCTSKHRQTLMFSATLSPSVTELACLALSKPIRVEMNKTHQVARSLQQYFISIASSDWKMMEACAAMLFMSNKELTEATDGQIRDISVLSNVRPIRSNDNSDEFPKTIIFFNKKINLKRFMGVLKVLIPNDWNKFGLLHADMKQESRRETMSNFLSGKIRVLLASDVASRGLDISDVEVVVNIGVPVDATRYVHRVGRTARSGRCGFSYTIFQDKELNQMKGIARDTNEIYKNKKNIKNRESFDPITVQESTLSPIRDVIYKEHIEINSDITAEHLQRSEDELNRLSQRIKSL